MGKKGAVTGCGGACRMHARIDRSLLRRQEAIGDDDDTKSIRNEIIQKTTARQESFEVKK